MTTLPISVTHDAGHSRFTAIVDGVPCVLDYQLQDGIMSIVHTGVPSEVGGRGIAAELTRHALETARAQGGACARCAPTRRCTCGVTRIQRPAGLSALTHVTRKADAATQPCPCESGKRYAECCGRWHAGPQFLQAPDAEALMRSRYSAFVLDRLDYLLATWHPDTRPCAGTQPGRSQMAGTDDQARTGARRRSRNRGIRRAQPPGRPRAPHA